jgi:hypothetical protein
MRSLVHSSACSFHIWGKDGPCSHLGGTSLMSWVTNQFPIIFKEIIRPERDAHQLLQYISEIQNVWGNTCINVHLTWCLSNWAVYYIIKNINVSCFLHGPYSCHYSTEYDVSSNKYTIVLLRLTNYTIQLNCISIDVKLIVLILIFMYNSHKYTSNKYVVNKPNNINVSYKR